MSYWLPILLFFPLMLLQGFFSGSEIALVSCNRKKMVHKAKLGSRSAQAVLKLLDHPERFLSITLAGTNYCNIANISLVTWFFIEHIHSDFNREAMITGFTLPIVLVFAEAVPKTLYRHFADQVAPFAAPILNALSIVFAPALFLIRAYSNGLGKLLFLKTEKSTSSASREELKRLLRKRSSKSEVRGVRGFYVSKILEFGELEARDAMLPLIQVQGIEAKNTVQEAVLYFAEVEHSRLPVFDERVDKIIGILHSFDLLGLEANDESFVKNLMRQALFVPPSQRLDSLFTEMRRSGHSMAIVVNEYGGAEGIVTIEDIVENVMGDIDDEFDDDKINIVRLSHDAYIVKGLTSVEEYNDTMPVQVPEGDYETVAGYLISQFERVPKRFEFKNVEGVQFTITKATDRSIDEIHVRIIRKRSVKG